MYSTLGFPRANVKGRQIVFHSFNLPHDSMFIPVLNNHLYNRMSVLATVL